MDKTSEGEILDNVRSHSKYELMTSHCVQGYISLSEVSIHKMVNGLDTRI